MFRLRVPYIVGRWVRGNEHYGRQRPIRYLLSAPDNAFWVVGTRRMGKTSLLRQLELLTAGPESEYVPLFWDMQGSETPGHLSEELLFAVDDARERFTDLGIELDVAPGVDALSLLRQLQRAVALRGRKLLLLIDEAEALIRIAEQDVHWLARLRKAFQSERQRTVMTSTKMLAKLNDPAAGWTTSPFLFGFNLVNLWQLLPEDGQALILQQQAEQEVDADPAVVELILHYTNGHPYLIQFLCNRLFSASDDTGSLRAICDEDLTPNQLLASFFEIDFQFLTTLERQIMLACAELRAPSERELIAALSDVPPSRLRTFIYGLHKLGYIRKLDDKWTVGNEFFRRWMRADLAALAAENSPPVSEANVEALLARGVSQEQSILSAELADLTDRLRRLESLAADVSGRESEDEFEQEIARIRRNIARTEQDFRFLLETVAQRI